MSSHPLYPIYRMLPISLQEVACWIYGKKMFHDQYNRYFFEKSVWLQKTERWTASEIDAYQNDQLRKIIKHAYKHVPYYREIMTSLKLTPADIVKVEDLHKLPILTKEDVRNNYHKLLADDANKTNLIKQHTSGTTGSSLHFYSTKAARGFQWAVWWRHRNRFGIDMNCWHVDFWAQLVVPPEQTKPPYWRWCSPLHKVMINMQHMTPEKIDDIIGFLNEHEFTYYTGFPSIIHDLVSTAMAKGLKLTSPPRMIITGSEYVWDFQRRDFEKFTGAVITDQYGFTEGCGNASQCPEFVYHEDFEFGIMECVEPKFLPDGRKVGKIICTGFACEEFPFIRYEIGDYGIWEDPTKKCKCGRESKIITGFDGRVEDYVITPENTRIMRFGFIFEDTEKIKESQVVQEKLGEITLNIVKRPGYSQKDEEKILNDIRKWASPTIKVKFVYLDEIEREANGKLRFVKSMLRNHPDKFTTY
jgi:phenylacetate-CoA ligase